MKASRLCTLVGVACVSLGLSEFTGCGSGDDTSTRPSSDASSEATPESSTDAISDALREKDATTDAIGSGSSVDSGDGAFDAPTGIAPDAATDATIGDAIAEVGTNQDADATPSCSVTVPASATGLLAAAATAVCARIQSCCALTNAQFNESECLQAYGQNAGWMSIGRVTPYIDSGDITYDPVAACECLEQSGSLSCGTVDSVTWDSLETTCLSAVHGNVPVGDAGCASSYECAQASYCNGSTCVPLVGAGGACTSNDMCDYISNGSPARYCDTSDASTAHSCIATLPAGSACSNTAICASNLCESPTPLECRSGVAFASAAVCSFLMNPDAGN
jgi:hypothetical protein